MFTPFSEYIGTWLLCGVGAFFLSLPLTWMVRLIANGIGDSPISTPAFYKRVICEPSLNDLIAVAFLIAGGFATLSVMFGLNCILVVIILFGLLGEFMEKVCNYSSSRGPLWTICKKDKP